MRVTSVQILSYNFISVQSVQLIYACTDFTLVLPNNKSSKIITDTAEGEVKSVRRREIFYAEKHVIEDLVFEIAEMTRKVKNYKVKGEMIEAETVFVQVSARDLLDLPQFPMYYFSRPQESVYVNFYSCLLG